MKNLGKIAIIILIFLIYPIQIYAFQVSGTPSQVDSGQKFEFTISMDESIYLANGHLTYNPELFTYISSDTPGIEIEKIRDGELAWIYTDLSDNPTGIQNIKFTFTAKNVFAHITDNFVISDSIYINTNETIYENQDFTKPITILAKQGVEMPATGGIGIIPFIFIGTILMYYGIKKIICRCDFNRPFSNENTKKIYKK